VGVRESIRKVESKVRVRIGSIYGFLVGNSAFWFDCTLTSEWREGKRTKEEGSEERDRKKDGRK